MAKPNIELGVPLMAVDHARLEGLFERVADTADAGLAGLRREIEAETRAHFQREEELMRSSQVPIYFCHVAQHNMILTEFARALQAEAAGDWPTLRRTLGVVLAGLIEAHVDSVDRVTASFLKGEIDAEAVAGLRLPVDN